MSTTAYSVDRCQGTYDDRCGTTYYYSTTRSHHDRLTTRPCSETVALHPAFSYARTHASEARCRHISLTDSIFTPPPPKTCAEPPSRRLRRGNLSSISHDPQADATSVRPICRLLTHLCHATPSTSPLVAPPYDHTCKYESIT